MGDFKVQLELFPEAERNSNSNGSARVYLLDSDQLDALGQANLVFVDVQVQALSQDGRVEFVCTTSSLGDQPPRFVGRTVKLTTDGTTLLDSVVISSPGIVRFWTKSDLLANTEITASVYHISQGGEAKARFSGWSTLKS